MPRVFCFVSLPCGMITTRGGGMTTLFEKVKAVKNGEYWLKAGMIDQLRQVDRTYVIWGRRRLSYFAGCDYFRLSSHPEVLQAVKEGLDRYGLNVAASRMTTG